MPKLEAVFYAAGNVRAFAQPIVDNGVMLVGAWDINAIPVTEMALAQDLLSCWGYYRTIRDYYESHDQGKSKEFRRYGVNGETVGLTRMGIIGKRLSELLTGFGFRVISQGPFLSDEQAMEIGVEKIFSGRAIQPCLYREQSHSGPSVHQESSRSSVVR